MRKRGRTWTRKCRLPSTRARLPLPHNNRTIGADNRESPTIQMLDFDQFLSEVDMVVIMVKHDHIKQNWDKLKGKVVLDCHNICPLEGVYHI